MNRNGYNRKCSTQKGMKPCRRPSKCEVAELRNIGEYLYEARCKWKKVYSYKNNVCAAPLEIVY
jgi:hypothetical protein